MSEHLKIKRVWTTDARDTEKSSFASGEDVFLWIASFSGPDAYECYKKSLAGNGDWAARIEPELRERVMRPTEVIELLPTRRSRLRHPPVPEH